MIVVCEPQCIGFVHVEVNAAMLSVISHAYPDETIRFLGEKGHLDDVKKKLDSKGITGIEYVPTRIPMQNFRNYKRFFSDLFLCKSVLDLASREGINRVVFTSVTSSCVVSLKILLRLYRRINCAVVTHDVLEKMLKPPSMLPMETPFWFRLVLPYGNLDRFRYIVLGNSLKEYLLKVLPRMGRYVDAIDLPSFFEEQDIPRRPASGLVRFGSFGVGALGKGTDRLFRLAENVKAAVNSNLEFILIGHIVDRKVRDVLNCSDVAVKVPSPDKPLSREEFDRLAKDVDYAVFLYPSDTYRLTASGALLDAFSYLKPVIATRNPYFEYYFRALGDIGYLCDDESQVKQVILDILKERPAERYLSQQKNMLEGRKRFEPPVVGEQFREIWERAFGGK